MERWMKILASVALVLLVIAGGLLVYVNVPNKAADLPEVVSAEARERDTLIATALVVGGVKDAFVDVTSERALVEYEVEAANETLQAFVMGAAAQGAPDSARLVIVQGHAGVVLATWSVETAKVLAFLDGGIDEPTLQAAIEKS